MLGKLIKHDFRHSARYHITILVVTVAVTVVVALSLLSDSALLSALTCFALAVTGIATVVVTLVSVIKNFYDTIYGRQGYLTLTLPVKGSLILLSKVIISFVWVVIGFCAMAMPYLVIFLYAKFKASNLTVMLGDMVESFLTVLPDTGVIVSIIVVLVVIAILKILTYVGYVYFSVTVANTRAFQNHPKLFGGLTFFGISVIMSQLGTAIGKIIPLTFVITLEKAFFSFKTVEEFAGAALAYPIGDTIIAGIAAIALLAATGYILEHKVNIK